jgi:hypothetical protein
MKKEVNQFWQMQTPERVEEPDSTPYIIVKKEEDD